MRQPAQAICPIRPDEILDTGDDGQSDGHVQGKGEMRDELGIKASETVGGETVESREEEVQLGKTMPTPKMPTQSELDEHRIDHIPYRSWCADCVEGFGREAKHCTIHPQTRWVPLVSCDILFLSSRCVYTREEWGAVESSVSSGAVRSSQEQWGAVRSVRSSGEQS